MTKRQLSITAAAAILLIAVFVFNKLSGAQGEPDLRIKSDPPMEILTFKADPKNLIPFIEFTGPVKARNQITLFSEVSGVMLSGENPFREGMFYAKGDIIFELDAREAELTLLSAKAGFKNLLTQIMPDLQLDYADAFNAWKGYLDRMDIRKPLAEPPTGNPEKLEFFLSSRNIWQQVYAIQSQEVRLTKFKLIAPFDGKVTSALVLPGALVRAGNPVGDFVGTGLFEMEASLDRRDIRFVNPGMKVTLQTGAGAENLDGIIRRIGGKIDDRTQTVKVFIEVNHPSLIDGMYLTGSFEAEPVNEAVELPRILIQNGDYVFTVTDSLLTRQKIDLVHVQGDKALVTGLKKDALIVARKMTETPQGIRVKSIETAAL